MKELFYIADFLFVYLYVCLLLFFSCQLFRSYGLLSLFPYDVHPSMVCLYLVKYQDTFDVESLPKVKLFFPLFRGSVGDILTLCLEKFVTLHKLFFSVAKKLLCHPFSIFNVFVPS